MAHVRVARFVSLLACLWLAGCIYSSRDLADEFAPQFPIRAGDYSDEDGATLTLETAGGVYRVTDPDSDVYEIAFFQVPGIPGYVVRLNPNRVGGGAAVEADGFAYGFAITAGATVEFRLVDMAAPPPAEVAALVKLDAGDDSGFEVRNPADTVRVLRLVAEKATLTPLMTLSPKR